jgi:hypothetical protein
MARGRSIENRSGRIRIIGSQEIPDHSTFCKNRHGRFRKSGVFRKVFEEIVRRCLEAGFVDGQNLAVVGTLVRANASQQSRVPRERLVEECLISLELCLYFDLQRLRPTLDGLNHVVDLGIRVSQGS